jgi:class 3 adenylate cyclase/tetratricopeptide (TPR) repeat protein
MTRCPSCGKELPGEFPFCPFCTAPLQDGAPTSALEERKVVSVLFCDLVGFTARSEKADPEDVRARLRPYHERVKQELERFGGTVEKFVGDAVMAVFGAPVIHEDDAERAVRAGLATLAAIEELNAREPGLDLTVRAAVNTGEAVVSLGARPERGDAFVAGDVVNTAARLQGAAPPGALVVSEATYRLTRDAVEYEPLPHITAKGKEESIPLWRACAFVGRARGDAARTPFVGRADELALLERTLARTLSESAVQLVTLVGEPGAGKSRLVAEIRRSTEAGAASVEWRHGRCLPYGEGITFWALGEIVKAECGILESDSVDDARSKLRAAVDAVVDGEERDWLHARLGPLVGISASGAVADRRELFTAWRSFLEALALQAPRVLVLEDMHWAGEPLLEFVEHLVDHLTDIPLLVLCTARPELYETRPGWGGGKRNSTTIALPPLAPAETARLVSAILARSILPVETQTAVMERAGGNPLFAEEFARMVTDRQTGNGDEAATDVSVPETVQALIAARLDTLPSERKALLHDAAVLGKVFWAEGVATMGGRHPDEVADALHELARKELIRSVRNSSVEGQREYAFWHVLVRDVAYAQIPRAERGRKHQAAAEWIEQLAGDRVADHAEVLAHHYREALALARTAGIPEERVVEGAQRFLIEAAERAERLDRAAAESLYLEALSLLESEDPRRTQVLGRLGWLAFWAGHFKQAEERFRAAITGADGVGRPAAAVDAIAGLSYLYSASGETGRADDLLEQWVRRLDSGRPDPVLGSLFSEFARRHMLAGRYDECALWADRAIEVHRTAGNRAAIVRPLQFRGAGRLSGSDFQGAVADMRESLRLSLELGLGIETNYAYVNLSNFVWWLEGSRPALELIDSGIEFAKRRGLEHTMMYTRAERLWLLFDLGAWDELLDEADELARWEQDATGGAIGTVGAIALPFKASVLVRRGETDDARALTSAYVDRLRQIGDPQNLVPSLAIAAVVALGSADPARALSLVAEIDEVAGDDSIEWRHFCLAEATRVCMAAGDLGPARRLRQSSTKTTPRNEISRTAADAILAEASGALTDSARLYGDAAARWKEFGNVPEQAHALLGEGRVLLALGRPGAAESLHAARDIFASLRYRDPLAEAEALLTQAAEPVA